VWTSGPSGATSSTCSTLTFRWSPCAGGTAAAGSRRATGCRRSCSPTTRRSLCSLAWSGRGVWPCSRTPRSPSRARPRSCGGCCPGRSPAGSMPWWRQSPTQARTAIQRLLGRASARARRGVPAGTARYPGSRCGPCRKGWDAPLDILIICARARVVSRPGGRRLLIGATACPQWWLAEIDARCVTPCAPPRPTRLPGWRPPPRRQAAISRLAPIPAPPVPARRKILIPQRGRGR
jgi:hypothetical protein